MSRASSECSFNNRYSIYLQQGGRDWYIADNTIVGDTPNQKASFDGENRAEHDGGPHRGAQQQHEHGQRDPVPVAQRGHLANDNEPHLFGAFARNNLWISSQGGQIWWFGKAGLAASSGV